MVAEERFVETRTKAGCRNSVDGLLPSVPAAKTKWFEGIGVCTENSQGVGSGK